MSRIGCIEVVAMRSVDTRRRGWKIGSRERCRCRVGTPQTTRALLKAASESKAHWRQDTDEVTVTLSVAKHITRKEIQLIVHPRRLNLMVDGQPWLTGSLEDVGEVDVDGAPLPDYYSSEIHPQALGSYWFMDDEMETDDARCLTVVLLKKVMGYQSFAHLLEDDVIDTTITHRVCASIEISGKKEGVLLFGLFGKATPETVQHFLSAVDEGGKEERKTLSDAAFDCIWPMSYAQFHLAREEDEPDAAFMQDVLRKEPKGLKHEAVGLLSMNPDQSLTEFVVTLGSIRDFDNKRTVFGKVTHGLELLARIEAQGEDKSGKVTAPVKITSCFSIKDSEVESVLEKEKQRRIFEDN